MLKIISPKARECYRHAAEASLRARQANRAAVRKIYFDLERHWLRLARRFELSERATNFSGELTRRLHALRERDAIPRVVCPQCGGKMRLAFLEPHPVPHTQKETTTFFCNCGETYSYTIATQL
jgi:hypothetical protein